MRPQSLDEFVGQEHLLGEGSALRAALESGRPHSMVLYGPPGTGKTTLARLAAEHADAAFEELSAVQAGRAEVREVIARAARAARRAAAATIFFLDEIHRFNKAQQDALLPAVEDGPGHADRRHDREPVLRGQQRAPLADADLRAQRAHAPTTSRRCCDGRSSATSAASTRVADEVIEFLAARAGGDARTALNALELARDHRGRRGGHARRRRGRAAAQGRPLRQGRRPALRLHLGLDQVDARLRPRRLALLPRRDARGRRGPALHRAADDRSSPPRTSATPTRRRCAVAVAAAAGRRARRACPRRSTRSPRPRSTCRWRRSRTPPRGRSAPRAATSATTAPQHPPAALRSAAYPGAANLGRGIGYDYPHDRPSHVNEQEHLPDGLEDLRFYEPDETERELRERLERIRKARGRD